MAGPLGTPLGLAQRKIEGVPDLPGAPQDEAGLTRKFETSHVGGAIFSSPVATAELSKFAGVLSAAVSQHHLLGFDIAQLEFHHLH